LLKRIVVVIPTYNERRNLPRLVESLEKTLSPMGGGHRVLIVDDDSPDGTGGLAEELGRSYDNISVLHRKDKAGIGSAYKAGFRHVLERFDPDIVVQMDADNSHDPKYIPEMVRMIGDGNHLVIGSRRVGTGSIVGWGYYRRSVSSTANLIVRATCGLDVKDTTSGYRAYSAECLRHVDLDSIRSDGYAFQIEMLAAIKRMEYRICEIPITFVDRREGRSKLSSGEMLEFIGACARVMFGR
jgi:dolichol-phosphate mannosyltransferase